MRSSWPILVAVSFIAAAAYWYDANNEVAAASASPDAQANVTQVTAAATPSDIARAKK